MSLSDEELHMLVEHLAEIHGVSPKEVIAGATGEAPEGYEFVDDAEPAEAAPAGSAKPAKAKKRRGPAHWVAWGSALVVSGVLVGAVVIAFLKFVNGPAAADIKPNQAGLPSKTPVVAATTDQLVGINFVLTFPHQFDQVQNLQANAGATESYRVGSKDNYKRLITVEVRPTHGGTLDDDASYKMRANEPDVYQQAIRFIGGEKVALMTKSGDVEETMFWIHGDKLLTIAITSSDPDDSIADFMNQVMSNIKWKK